MSLMIEVMACDKATDKRYEQFAKPAKFNTCFLYDRIKQHESG